jgi:hypothetical protein
MYMGCVNILWENHKYSRKGYKDFLWIIKSKIIETELNCRHITELGT